MIDAFGVEISKATKRKMYKRVGARVDNLGDQVKVERGQMERWEAGRRRTYDPKPPVAGLGDLKSKGKLIVAAHRGKKAAIPTALIAGGAAAAAMDKKKKRIK